MFVIIEGPDGAGKTTLISKLRTKLPFYVWVLSSNSRYDNWGQVIEVVEWIETSPVYQPFLLDRHPLISETVYGPILRGGVAYKNSASDIVEWMANTFGDSFIVYCNPGLDVLEKTSEAHSQRKGVRENLPKIVKAYDSLMEMLVNDIPVERYDFSLDHGDKSVDRLVIDITHWKEGMG